MSRKIEDLDPRCQDAARKTLDALAADDELRNSGVSGWLVVETRRELAVQMAYFARGRMAPDHVRMMYQAAGIGQRIEWHCAHKNRGWSCVMVAQRCFLWHC